MLLEKGIPVNIKNKVKAKFIKPGTHFSYSQHCHVSLPGFALLTNIADNVMKMCSHDIPFQGFSPHRLVAMLENIVFIRKNLNSMSNNF